MNKKRKKTPKKATLVVYFGGRVHKFETPASAFKFLDSQGFEVAMIPRGRKKPCPKK